MTALDMLNIDCWNSVLNFVPVKDIVRSERVSHQWRDIVMQYLQGTHLCLYLYSCSENPYYNKCIPECRIIELPWPNKENRLHLIRKVTKKFGPSIIASQCTNKAVFKIIKRNCPNLQQLMFLLVSDNNYNVFTNEKCMKLKWISFRSCNLLTDRCVSSFLENETISELDFYSNERMNGRCLKNINVSRLTSLCLNNCVNLDMRRVFNLRDKYLESMARGCPLQYLDISCCDEVTVRGLHALSLAGGTLRTLSISYIRAFSSDDVASCVAGLPNLKVLEVVGTNVTSRLAEAIQAQARPCPLRIFATDREIPKTKQYAGIILDQSIRFSVLSPSA